MNRDEGAEFEREEKEKARADADAGWALADKLQAALEDCWEQFAYEGKNGLWAGGLSELEHARWALDEYDKAKEERGK
jgi:hypothetical protein